MAESNATERYETCVRQHHRACACGITEPLIPHDEMMLRVHAGEELRMLQALREPGTSTLLSNTTIDRLIDVLERVSR